VAHGSDGHPVGTLAHVIAHGYAELIGVKRGGRLAREGNDIRMNAQPLEEGLSVGSVGVTGKYQNSDKSINTTRAAATD